jgi:hypothetical protein
MEVFLIVAITIVVTLLAIRVHDEHHNHHKKKRKPTVRTKMATNIY